MKAIAMLVSFRVGFIFLLLFFGCPPPTPSPLLVFKNPLNDRAKKRTDSRPEYALLLMSSPSDVGCFEGSGSLPFLQALETGAPGYTPVLEMQLALWIN